jgi:hypothetical protein
LTDTEPAPDLPAITLPAEFVIPAWRNAWLATGDDDDRPALYRTVLMEWFPAGVRFVATDGYMLVVSYASADREDIRPDVPEHDVSPTGSVVAIAADRLMADFLKHRAVEVKAYQRALYETGAAEPVNITFSIGTIDEPNSGQQQLDLGEDKRRLIVSCDMERIALPLYDGEYATWRNILASYRPSPRAKVAVAADLLRRIGQLNSLPHSADDDWLNLTMANGGTLVRVDGVGRVPIEGAFAPRREAAEEQEAA